MNLTPQEGALLIGFRGISDDHRSIIVSFCLDLSKQEQARAKAERKQTLRLATVNGQRQKQGRRA